MSEALHDPQVLITLCLVGFFVIALQIKRWFAHRWLRMLAMVADRHGLTIVSVAGAPMAVGWVGPIALRIERVKAGRQDSVLVAATVPDLPKDFVLRTGTLRDRMLGEDDVELGAAEFDRAVLVRGEEHRLRALLDAEVRDGVVAALEQGVAVADGQVRFSKPSSTLDRHRLRRATEAVITLARSLSASEDERSRLLQIAQRDREPALKVGALRALLARKLLTHAEQITLLQAAEVPTRVLLAPLVGVRAWPLVEALVGDRALATELRRDALLVLRGLDLHRAVPIARQAFATSNPGALSTAALEVLAAAAECPPLAALAESIAIRLPDLRIAVARCLQHSAEPAEPQLLELLQDIDDEVAQAAALALQVHGSPAAVTPLRTRMRGFATSRELRSLFEATIEHIQGSVGDLGGGLAIAQDRAEGGLTLQKSESIQRDG